MADTSTTRLMEPFNWHKPTEAQRVNRQAWKEYCSLENLSNQRIGIDKMRCTGCGEEFVVAHLSDGGLCNGCCNRVVFEK
jgi:hypothetical protein